MSPTPERPIAPPLSDALYARAYALRKAASTMTDEARVWLGEAAEALVAAAPGDRPFTVLSVGCGEGDLDVEFARALAAALGPRPLAYRGLEPNPEHRSAFEARTRDGDWPAQVTFSTSAARFGEAEHAGPYDVVLMCHVLYYMPDVGAALERARDLLAPTGAIVVVHQTGEGIPPLQRRFMAELKGDTAELLTTDEIAAAIDAIGAPYVFHHRDAWLDATETLAGTADGLDVLSFCLECDLRPLGPARVAPLHAALRAACRVDQSGRALLREPIGVFVLPATPLTVAPRLVDPVDDYRRLASLGLWPDLLAELPADARILDVACGSGRWLSAFFARHGAKLSRPAGGIAYDLLDPNADAAARCARRIHPPLHHGRTFAQPLEEADLPAGAYDLIWSMHGFYAIPPAALPGALRAMRAALAPGGRALIALSTGRGFYDWFYRLWALSGRTDAHPFTRAEDIEAALAADGVPFEAATLTYDERIPADEPARLLRYLVDEAIGNSFAELGSAAGESLAALLADPVLGPALAELESDGAYALPHEVRLIAF